MRIRLPWALLLLTAMGGCWRDGLYAPQPDAGSSSRGIPGIGVVVRMLPDGGLTSLLGDGGLANLICGPKVKLGRTCSSEVPACVLSNLSGVCVCTSGRYLCSSDTASGPQTCPVGVTTGTLCLSPLSICIAQDTACLCGTGTYTCL